MNLNVGQLVERLGLSSFNIVYLFDKEKRLFLRKEKANQYILKLPSAVSANYQVADFRITNDRDLEIYIA